jgi:tetratricopeptide (TPR) repeat protein
MSTQKSSKLLLSLALAASVLLSPKALSISPTAYQHYQAGVVQEKLSNWKQAELEYRSAMGLDPYDSRAYVRLANLLSRLGRSKEALSMYQNAQALHANDPSIALSLAQLLEQQGQPLKALQQYQTVIQNKPDLTYVYKPMANLASQTNQPLLASRYMALYNQSHPQQPIVANKTLPPGYSLAGAAAQPLSSPGNMLTNPNDNLNQAALFIQQGRPQDALTLLKRLNGSSASYFELTGMAHESLRQVPEAIENYEKAVVLAPKEKNQLNLKIAQLATAAKQPKDAENALENYTKHNKTYLEAYKELGKVYITEKNYSGAIEAYQHTVLLAQNRDSLVKATAYKDLGYAYQLNGNADLAVKQYETSLALKDMPSTKSNMATLFVQTGQTEKAIELYKALIAEQPRDAQMRQDAAKAYVSLGDKAQKVKNYKSALESYQQALAVAGTDYNPALMGMAQVYTATKDKKQADKLYGRLLDKDPANPSARYNKAKLDIENNRLAEGLESLRSIVSQNPSHLEAIKLLAQTHETMGDYAQSLSYYQKAIVLAPKDPLVLNGYGNCWRKTGDVEKAMKAYELAKSYAPYNPKIRYNLASIYTLQNKLSSSELEYKAALKLDPSFSESYYGLGIALEKQNKPVDAISAYQSYLNKAAMGQYAPLAKKRIEALKRPLGTAQKSTIEPPASPMRLSAFKEKPGNMAKQLSFGTAKTWASFGQH